MIKKRKEMLESRIKDLCASISINKLKIVGLKEEVSELEEIRRGLLEILKNEDKAGVKEGGKKGRGC